MVTFSLPRTSKLFATSPVAQTIGRREELFETTNLADLTVSKEQSAGKFLARLCWFSPHAETTAHADYQ